MKTERRQRGDKTTTAAKNRRQWKYQSTDPFCSRGQPHSTVANDADWRSHLHPNPRSRVDDGRGNGFGHPGKPCCPTCGRNSERPNIVARRPAHGPPRSRVTRRREVRPIPRDSTEMEANREIGLRGGVAWRPRGSLPAPQAAQMHLSQTTKAPASGPLPRYATASASTPDNGNLRPSTYAAVVAREIPRGDDTSKGGRLTAQGRQNWDVQWTRREKAGSSAA